MLVELSTDQFSSIYHIDRGLADIEECVSSFILTSLQLAHLPTSSKKLALASYKQCRYCRKYRHRRTAGTLLQSHAYMHMKICQLVVKTFGRQDLHIFMLTPTADGAGVATRASNSSPPVPGSLLLSCHPHPHPAGARVGPLRHLGRLGDLPPPPAHHAAPSRTVKQIDDQSAQAPRKKASAARRSILILRLHCSQS